jgi:type IX secretion system PorP/SprF family membrane protein
MKQLMLLLVLFSCRLPLQAQQDAQFSQYIFNGIYINPAYAGYKEELNAHAFYRSQWTGVTGAPQSMSLAVDGSLRDNTIGLALQVAQDKIGAQSNLSVYANYAYRIKLDDETSCLALGLGAGFIQLGLDGTKLDPNNPNDPYVPVARQSTLIFDARAGIYFSTEHFFAGFSADNIAAQLMDKHKPITLTIPTPKPHYYLTAGGLLQLSENVYFKPSFLLKDDRGGPTNLDLNAFFLLKQVVWAGMSYRTAVTLYSKPYLQSNLSKSSAIIGMLEVFATPQLRVGYAYDYDLNKFQTYNNGTHEVSIGYYFNRNGGKKTALQQTRCFSF